MSPLLLPSLPQSSHHTRRRTHGLHPCEQRVPAVAARPRSRRTTRSGGGGLSSICAHDALRRWWRALVSRRRRVPAVAVHPRLARTTLLVMARPVQRTWRPPAVWLLQRPSWPSPTNSFMALSNLNDGNGVGVIRWQRPSHLSLAAGRHGRRWCRSLAGADNRVVAWPMAARCWI
jgi:hypothetical protein